MGACNHLPMLDESALAGFIKEIGRGRNAARDLARQDAKALFAAMLARAVPDLQCGAVLIALRVKGESLDELAGFAAACEGSYAHLRLPLVSSAADRRTVPLVIPSYNGARQLPNLVPLLALLLARQGVRVLVHGVTEDPGRVTTREVFAALGIQPSLTREAAQDGLATRGLSFMPVAALAPDIAAMLALRRALGVRNSTHTLVKMLQPFEGPAVRLVSVTHPDYLIRMREYFTQHDTSALLLRGAEGEAVAHPRREPSIEWAYDGQVHTWLEDDKTAWQDEPELPSRDAGATARWIESVLDGRVNVPRASAHQVACCIRAVETVSAGGLQ